MEMGKKHYETNNDPKGVSQMFWRDWRERLLQDPEFVKIYIELVEKEADGYIRFLTKLTESKKLSKKKIRKSAKALLAKDWSKNDS